MCAHAGPRGDVGCDVKAVNAGDVGGDYAVSILPFFVMLLMRYSQPIYPRRAAENVLRQARRDARGETLGSAVKYKWT